MNEQSNQKKKSKKKYLIIGILFLIGLVGGIMICSSLGIIDIGNINPLTKTGLNLNAGEKESKTEYVEILVHTSDNVISKQDQSLWSDKMIKEDRAYSGKQGYVITMRPEGSFWGDMERDPKRGAILKIPKSEWNESWIEPEYNYSAPIYAQDEKTIMSYEIISERKYRIPLENFLTESELTELKNIPYNDPTKREPIIKTISNISAIVEKVDWSKMPETIKLHGSAGTKAICDNSSVTPCDYSSLITWEAFEQADLTGAGPCIANITGSWGRNDTTSFDIAGWTATPTDYIKIVTENNGARHDGKWNWTAYRLVYTGANGGILTVQETNVIIDGIQVYSTSNVANGGTIYFRSGGGNTTISHNILRGTPGTGTYYDGIQVYTTALTNMYVKVYNNIIYDFSGAVSDSGVSFWDDGNKWVVYSNTIFNTALGIYSDTGNAPIVKNNIVSSTGTCYNVAFNATSDYNACNGTDTTAQGTHNFVNQNYSFVDVVNRDLHLSSTQAQSSAIGNGTDLSADGDIAFSTDIDYQTRSGTWDLGADEYITSGPSTCLCPANPPANWEINMGESCVIISTCDLQGGNITFTGTGTTIFNASIMCYDLDTPGSGQTLKIGSVGNVTVG